MSSNISVRRCSPPYRADPGLSKMGDRIGVADSPSGLRQATSPNKRSQPWGVVSPL